MVLGWFTSSVAMDKIGFAMFFVAFKHTVNVTCSTTESKGSSHLLGAG